MVFIFIYSGIKLSHTDRATASGRSVHHMRCFSLIFVLFEEVKIAFKKINLLDHLFIQ